jgi:hypothetical protein
MIRLALFSGSSPLKKTAPPVYASPGGSMTINEGLWVASALWSNTACGVPVTLSEEEILALREKLDRLADIVFDMWLRKRNGPDEPAK